MRYGNVLKLFYTHAWAMEVNSYHALRGLLEGKAVGIGPDLDDLEAWQAAQPYGAQGPQGPERAVGTSIALIPIYGPMLLRAGGMERASGYTSTSQAALFVREAARDPSIREIVLDIDSPGGDADSVDVLVAAIHEAKAEKRVTAVSEGMMASAAYWIAAQADRIVTTPGAMVGSISVIASHTDQSERDAAEGVKVEYITTGSKKALGNPHQPLSDDGRAEIMRVAMEYHHAFVNAVADGRGLSAERVQSEWADGRVEIGSTALRLGMTDEIGTLQDVIDGIRSEASTSTSRSRGARAEGQDTVKIKDVIAALRAGATEAGEQGTSLEIDPATATEMADAVEELEADAVSLGEAAQELSGTLVQERREALVERALNAASLPPVSVESDAKFRQVLNRTSIAAEDEATATQAIAQMIEDRKAVVGAGKTDNNPGLPPKRASGENEDDSARAIGQIRARVPELN